MNRKQSAFALALIILSATTAVHAVSPPQPPPAETQAAPVAQPGDATPAKAPAVDRALLSPMHLDIEVAVEEEKARVEELNRRFLAASLPTEKIAIQKEIEAVKKNGMIAVFEIQLRYAEEEGRTTTAEQLRTTIEAIRNPKRPEGTGE